MALLHTNQKENVKSSIGSTTYGEKMMWTKKRSEHFGMSTTCELENYQISRNFSNLISFSRIAQKLFSDVNHINWRVQKSFVFFDYRSVVCKILRRGCKIKKN